MNDLKASIIRTLTPLIVMGLTSWGVAIDSARVEAAITAAVGLVFYVVIRVIETKIPKAGWLLGAATQPHYK